MMSLWLSSLIALRLHSYTLWVHFYTRPLRACLTQNFLVVTLTESQTPLEKDEGEK